MRGLLGREKAETFHEEPASPNIWQEGHFSQSTVNNEFLGVVLFLGHTFGQTCVCTRCSLFLFGLDYTRTWCFPKNEHAHRLQKAGRRPRSGNASRGPRRRRTGATPGPLSTKKAWVGGSLKLGSVDVEVIVLVQNQHILFAPPVPPSSHRMCKIMYKHTSH